MTRWPITRYLLLSHTVFLIMFLAVAYLVIGVVLAVCATLMPITISAVDVAGQPLFWLAIAYGYSAVGMLTTALAHGRTRREFLLQHPVFILLNAVVLAALITGVHAVEAVVYRLAGWPRNVEQYRVFEAGDYPMIFLAYLSMLTVCVLTGTFLGAAFYRWEAAGTLALLPAGVLLVLTGAANGLFNLPFARLGPAGAPALIAVTAGAFAVAWALLWGCVHDIALRTKVPA